MCVPCCAVVGYRPQDIYPDRVPAIMQSPHPAILSGGSMVNFSRVFPFGGSHLYQQNRVTLRREEVSTVWALTWLQCFQGVSDWLAVTSAHAGLRCHRLLCMLGVSLSANSNLKLLLHAGGLHPRPPLADTLVDARLCGYRQVCCAHRAAPVHGTQTHRGPDRHAFKGVV